eukprot:5675878-Pleurochrysis_carterae.AAC.7
MLVSAAPEGETAITASSKGGGFHERRVRLTVRRRAKNSLESRVIVDAEEARARVLRGGDGGARADLLRREASLGEHKLGEVAVGHDVHHEDEKLRVLTKEVRAPYSREVETASGHIVARREDGPSK